MLEMPRRQFAGTNSVRLAYSDAGPRDDPTPLVLCHGWPEIAFTRRRQIKGRGLSRDCAGPARIQRERLSAGGARSGDRR